MKILFTGCTPKQVDDNAWRRVRVQRIDDSSIICNSLRGQGYIVDRRPVKWGDDLSDYGLAIVGFSQFGSSYASEIFNALWAIKSAKNVIIFHEDWKIEGTMKSCKKMVENDDFFKKSIRKKWSTGKPFYKGLDNPHFNADEARAIVKKIMNGEYEHAIIPAFDWGDKEIVRDIIKVKNIYNIDLTPYVLDNWNIPLDVTTQKKEKKHMLASLVDHRPWVRKNKLKWPVDYYGAKQIEDAPQLDTETDVFETCGRYWGVLCPEYPHAGSGWFRIRWIYAAIQKSITISSKMDLEALGLPLVDVETLSDDELVEYAKLQSDTVLSYMWDKETFDKKLSIIMDSICPDLTKNKDVGPAPFIKSSLF